MLGKREHWNRNNSGSDRKGPGAPQKADNVLWTE